MEKGKKLTALLLAIIFIAAVAYGVGREEFVDVMANARIICYSCIGLK